MKSRKTLALVGALAILTAAACVTINVYFPEEAVRDLAVQIEDAVERRAEAQDGGGSSEPAAEPPVEEAATEPQTVWIPGLIVHLLGPAPAYAQGDVVAPEISNPAIRAIIASRAKRANELARLKQQGVVGENNRALVEIRSLDSLELRERASVQKLVKEENEDRETMFKEIAAATGADLSTLPQIRTTYAETIRQKAAKGDPIQLPDGSWTRK